ncbi:hypothetical protein Aple_094400 [Acrocarpospora pleiomorpha]|uniref:Uncharacterized protein n=1 Tax=Acrocarpospora pleiomorpha TaxID=90975 RepID=A0A5M3Y3W7_9ACTN|nr:hypothetical protein Aple_094400 [Acrocarpospora pleiomorpha]
MRCQRDEEPECRGRHIPCGVTIAAIVVLRAKLASINPGRFSQPEIFV